MPPRVRELFSTVERARNAVYWTALGLGGIGFSIAMLALFLG